MRINRFLARSGVSSRRKVEEQILAGRVSINGKVITDLATEIDPKKDDVRLSGKKIELPAFVYLALNKPEGYTVTKSDAHAVKTVFELLPEIPGLVAVGRLDRDSRGLLIFTNDGNFAQNLIHPSKSIEKEYLVRTKESLPDLALSQLRAGVDLEDGFVKPVSVDESEDGFKIVITQGKKRQVRRMFKSVGVDIKYLQRIRIGTIELSGKEGQFRNLSEEEIAAYANLS